MNFDFFDNRRLKLQPKSKVQTCTQCGMHVGKRHPIMEPYGKFKLGIMNIGEAPGEMEDLKGKPWQGRVGKLLYRTYGEFGIDLFEDCINMNSVLCRPLDKDGNNRKPTSKEIANCRRKVLNVIIQYKPKLIMLFGNAAIESVIGYRWKSDLRTISRWRGLSIPDRDLGCWVYSTFHPSYAERDDTGTVEVTWRKDIRRGLKLLDKPFPKFRNDEKRIIITDDPDFLDDIKSPFSFDYETTGIKPQRKEHDILCISICDSMKRSFVFKKPDKGTKMYTNYCKIMKDPHYKKIAQNLKYEDNWTREKFNTTVRGWLFDPMLASHIIDNRPYFTGLKFQVYINFGVIDYSSEVGKWMESIEIPKSGNSVNRLREFVKTEDGWNKLMIYCGLDSLYEFWLYRKYAPKMGIKL